MANAARRAMEESSAASSVGCPSGNSAYATGRPSALSRLGLETCHTRAAAGSALRRASSSVRSGVTQVVKALPRGFCGPVGTRWTSISSTEFPVASSSPESTAISSRAENRCWWYGAPRPGAISEAYGYGEPSSRAPG